MYWIGTPLIYFLLRFIQLLPLHCFGFHPTIEKKAPPFFFTGLFTFGLMSWAFFYVHGLAQTKKKT